MDVDSHGQRWPTQLAANGWEPMKPMAWRSSNGPLPIDPVLETLKQSLAVGHALLTAPTGSGKTTRVPLALLDADWLQGGSILMLEPRRPAARMAAARMATMLEENVGETVGHQVRFERRIGPRTRIEVLTEGILTRRIQGDPELSGCGLLIFDEFHERSLQADLGLALALDVASLREDLRILVMSATLDSERLAALLGDAPVIRGAGRAYPVGLHYLERPERDPLTAMLPAVRRALAAHSGDLLVFLPGAGEIQRLAGQIEQTLASSAIQHSSLLQRQAPAAEKTSPAADLADELSANAPAQPAATPGRSAGARKPAAATKAVAGIEILPFHGSLPLTEQDRALRPTPNGRRRIVLATDIAETSLTIEGIEVVIDSGLTRKPRFEPGTGLTRLVTQPISQASAEQRAGRAGRLGPGQCYRLWSQVQQQGRPAQRGAEILEADLAPLALELALWGIKDPAQLSWLDPPPRAAWAQAVELLQALAVLDAGGAITAAGRRLVALPVHPRLSHMLLTVPASARRLACDLAALLEERDPWQHRPGRWRPIDLQPRLEALERARHRQPTPDFDPARLRTVQRAAAQFERLIAESTPASRLASGPGLSPASPSGRTPASSPSSAPASRPASGPGSAPASRSQRKRAPRRPADPMAEANLASTPSLGAILSLAYPERIARRREGAAGVQGGTRYLLRNGSGAELPRDDALAIEPWLVIADLDAARGDHRIRAAAAISEAEVRAHFAAQISSSRTLSWDAQRESVIARIETRLGAILIDAQPAPLETDDNSLAILLAAIERDLERALTWSQAARQFCARIQLARRLQPDEDWPDFTPDGLRATLEHWLAPWLDGKSRLTEVRALDLTEVLRQGLGWDKARALDMLAPTRLHTPADTWRPIDYAAGEQPVLQVPLQELFGASETPSVFDGRQALLLHLLSPAGRPLQVTQDLAAFWSGAYAQVRKEMRGRYPKHHWPEDPASDKPIKGGLKRHLT